MADRHRTVRRQLFPEKLWELVNKPSSGIQWSPDGKRIEVDRKQLEKFIGTKFRSQNFDSFIRQLHFYGFRKCGNSYHHEKFQRGQPEALLAMRRKYSMVLNNNELKLGASTLAQQVTLPDAVYDVTDQAIDYSKTRKPSPAKLQPPIAVAATTAADNNNSASVHFADELGDKMEESVDLEDDDCGTEKSNTENIMIYSLQTDSRLNNIAQPIYGKTEDAFPSFSKIKATPTQAIVDKNSVTINLTEAMGDQRADAWPKTLVLNKFQVGGQTLLSAHFLYKIDNVSKP